MAKIFNLSDLLEGCLKVLLSFTRVKRSSIGRILVMEKNGGWGFFQLKELVSPTKIFGWTRQSQWEMVRSVIKQLSFNKLWHFHEQCLLPWLHFWHISLQSICLRGEKSPSLDLLYECTQYYVGCNLQPFEPSIFVHIVIFFEHLFC